MDPIAQRPRDLSLDGLKVEARVETDETVLHWTGRSGARDPAQDLLPYLEGVVAWGKQRGNRIALHVEKTEFLNSSTLAVVMRMLRQALALEVKVAIYYDGTVLWQRFAFPPMAVLGRGSAAGLTLHALTAPPATQP
jgi:hypothetical protein